MNFFLGFFPDEKSTYGIKKIIRDIHPVFDGQQIPVRWSKPETFHMTILHIGNKLPFYKRIFLKHKFKNIKFNNFKIKFKTVKLGISRKYQELIYLDIQEGGEEMRNLLFEFRKYLGISDTGNFIPHLTLGRVSKDLTRQEYGNLSKDLKTVAKDLKIGEIEFEVTDISLIKSKDGNYDVLMNFKDCFNTES